MSNTATVVNRFGFPIGWIVFPTAGGSYFFLAAILLGIVAFAGWVLVATPIWLIKKGVALRKETKAVRGTLSLTAGVLWIAIPTLTALGTAASASVHEMQMHQAFNQCLAYYADKYPYANPLYGQCRDEIRGIVEHIG